MTSQKTIALASVAGVAGLAGFYVNRQMSSSLERNPFIVQGVEAAQLDPTKIGYWKLAHQDSMNNVGYATVSVGGKKVRVSARLNASSASRSSEQSPSDAHMYDDLEAEGSGLAFYWENPWEIKASAIRGLKAVKSKILQYTVVGSPEVVEEKGSWELLTVVVDDEAVIGDKLGHPDFASEAFLGVNGMKSEKSKNRAMYVLAGLGSTALFLGIKRGYTNYRLWPAYVFARTYVTKHPLVAEFFKSSEVEVVTRTGIFKRNKIEGEITITGKGQSGESVVKFAASRSTEQAPWTVSQALMTPTGCKPIDLLATRSL